MWRSAGPLVVGRGLAALVGLALPAVLARALDPHEYGTYKQFYLVAMIALNAMQFGLAQSLFYFVPRAGTEGERRALIGQTQMLLGAVGLVVGTVLAFGAPILSRSFTNPAFADLSLPLGLIAGTLLASAPLEITLTARGRPWSTAAVMGVTELVRVAGMLAPIGLGYGVVGLAWGAAGAGIARWLLSLWLLRGSLRLDTAQLVQQLHYALPMGVASLFALPQSQMHQLVVAAGTTPDLFAIYAVGCLQIPVVGLLYSPVSETLQVKLAGLERTGRTHEAGPALAAAVDRLSLVFLPLCAFLIATAEPALRILYGERYVASATILRIGVASVAIASLPLDSVLKARARTPTLLAISAAKLAVTWPAVTVAFARWGPVGAIGMHVAIELVTRLSQLWLVARELRSPVYDLVGGATFGRALAISAGLAVVGSRVAQAVSNPWLACAAVGAVACGSMGLEVWWRRAGQAATA